MDRKAKPQSASGISRRDFLLTTAAAGAGLALGPRAFGITSGPKDGDIHVALVGAGTQGQVLTFENGVKLPGIRFKAVCDIWPYNRDRVVKTLARYKHEAAAYTDLGEMLAAEKDLDAAIVATPDWVHAEQAIACLKAGLHVYCEKEMSNSLDAARQMVVAARETGRLLQIGHQRRSNPRYHAALDYIRGKKALGRVTFVSGHWNRARPLRRGWAKGIELDDAALGKYGYDTMERLLNWRWYRKFSGGAIADLGSHQIDIFHWFLQARPTAVMAMGGTDYYTDMEWYDNVNALYEWQFDWEGARKPVRGFYQTLSTTSHSGFAETFMGTEGSLIISEYEGMGGIRREQDAEEQPWEKPLLKALEAQKAQEEKAEAPAEEDDLKIGHSVPMPGRYYPPIPPLAKPVHMPHLENFFDAIRGKAKLTCPAEVGYETAVSVLRVNDAVAAGRRLEFKPEEFAA